MHIKITAHHKNISQQLIEQFAAYPTLSRELSDIAEIDRRTVTGTPKIERYATAEVADITARKNSPESCGRSFVDCKRHKGRKNAK